MYKNENHDFQIPQQKYTNRTRRYNTSNHINNALFPTNKIMTAPRNHHRQQDDSPIRGREKLNSLGSLEHEGEDGRQEIPENRQNKSIQTDTLKITVTCDNQIKYELIPYLDTSKISDNNKISMPKAPA